jgi:hypothetical protein
LHVAIRLNPATLDAPLIFSAPLSSRPRASERHFHESDVFSRLLNGIPQETFLSQPFDGPLAPFKSSRRKPAQTPFKVHARAPEFLNFKASRQWLQVWQEQVYVHAHAPSARREECSLFCFLYSRAICSKVLQGTYLD